MKQHLHGLSEESDPIFEALSLVARNRCSYSNALFAAKARPGGVHPRVEEILEYGEQVFYQPDAIKAGVAAITTGDLPAFAQSALDAWLRQTASVSLLDAIMPLARRSAIGAQYGVTSIGASGFNVPEANWSPITKMSFAGSTGLQPSKSMTITVLSADTLRFSADGGKQLLRAELANAISKETNLGVLPKLLDSLTLSSSSGNPRLDLALLLDQVNIDQDSKLLLITSPRVMKQLAMASGSLGGPADFPDIKLPSGGDISGIGLLGIDGCADFGSDGDIMVLVDCAQCVADSRALEILVSDQASVLMTDNASGTAAASMTSLWQNDSIGIRLARFWALAKGRTSAAAALKDVSYSGSSPP